MEQQVGALLERQQAQHAENMRQTQQLVNSVLAMAQQAQTAAAASASAAASTVDRLTTEERRQISSVIDPKILERRANLSGKDEDFPEWEVKLKSLASLIGIDAEMAVAVAEPTEDVVMLDALHGETCRNKVVTRRRRSTTCWCRAASARR